MKKFWTGANRRLAGAWSWLRVLANAPVKVGWFVLGVVLIFIFWFFATSETARNINLFEFVTLLVLAATAFVLFRTYTAIKTNSDQEFLRSFFERYEKKEMYQSITALSDFGRNNANKLREFRNLLDSDNPQITDEDEKIARDLVSGMDADANLGRRRVLNLYKNPWRMFEKRYLGTNSIRLVAETNAVRLLHPTVMPASAAVHLVDVCKLNRDQFLKDRERFFWIKEFRDWRYKNMPSAYWDEPA